MSDIETTPLQKRQGESQADFEKRLQDSMCVNASEVDYPWYWNLSYAAVGVLFGIAFIKAEIVSWFRIQEMFHLQSFHMYGVIGTAVVVGMISVYIIKKFKLKSVHNESIEFHDKTFSRGQVIGGLIFGLGWALTGACPGPLFAQLGTGALVVLVIIFSAIAGTWVYGRFKDYF